MVNLSFFVWSHLGIFTVSTARAPLDVRLCSCYVQTVDHNEQKEIKREMCSTNCSMLGAGCRVPGAGVPRPHPKVIEILQDSIPCAWHDIISAAKPPLPIDISILQVNTHLLVITFVAKRGLHDTPKVLFHYPFANKATLMMALVR